MSCQVSWHVERVKKKLWIKETANFVSFCYSKGENNLLFDRKAITWGSKMKTRDFATSKYSYDRIFQVHFVYKEKHIREFKY